MSRRLPVIHGITERSEGLSERIVEVLDLEVSNGERRHFHRQKPHGHGAVVVVPMLDDDTVLLVREYAAGVHRYELGLVKGRIDAGESPIEAANREDLAAIERAEIVVIEKYLPTKRVGAEIQAAIDAAVAETGATGPADMGKLMGVLKPRLAGQADMGLVSALVKKKFSN